MADEGGTTVGSINAKLVLDDSDWKTKLDAAQARADALGKSDPTIRVTADTADATASLAEIQAAIGETVGSEGSLSGATLDIDASFAAAQVSLDAYVDSLQAAAGVSDEATVSQQAYVESLVETVAAEEAVTAATNGQNAASTDSLKSWQLIGAVIGGVVALSGPLSGFIAGVGGGLAGMGAAGVLAVLGINDAIKDGTALGSAYSSGLKSLKGDLDSIASTAAVGMLGDFQRAEAMITSDLPSLNSEIATFTGLLGDAGDNALQGVISGLKTANPLFVDGAQYADGLAQSFDNWTSDGGLQKFVTYAEQELPIVENAVDSLSGAVVSLGGEFTPLGNDILDVVNDGSRLVSMFTSASNWLDNLVPKTGAWAAPLGIAKNALTDMINPLGDIEQMIPGLTDLINGWTGATSAGTANVGALYSQKSALDSTTTSWKNLATAQSNAETAAQNYTSYITASNADALKLDQANSQLEQSYQTLGSTVTNNLASMTRAQATSLDVSTAAGLQNHENISQSVSDAEAQAAAVVQSDLEQGKSKAQATADGNANLKSSEGALVSHAAQAGLDAGAVQDLINKLVTVPANVNSNVTVTGLASAAAQVAAWKTSLAQTSVQVQVYADTHGTPSLDTPSNPNAHAHGGTIFAASGMTVGGVGSSFSDSVPARLSVGEEVIRASSASQVRPFLKALNANPGKALSAVAASGSGSGPTSFNVIIQSKGGIDLSQYIDVKIQKASNAQAVAEGTGLQRQWGG